MTVTITQESPDSPDAVMLIAGLIEYLGPLYPGWSQSGLSPDHLVRDGVAFFIMRYDEVPAGCGGLKLYGDKFAEVKRMYVRPQFRGKGLGTLMLRRLEEHALEHGITVLRLETGIYQPEAMDLYERLGYRQIPPFPPYEKSTQTLSRFYEKCIR